MVAATVVAAACGQQFEPVSSVSGTRILAVQGAPAYAAPGDKVSLEALTVDTLGRKLSMGWTTCTLPTSSVVNGCFAKIAEDVRAGKPPVFTTGDGLTKYDFTVPADVLAQVPDEARSNAMIGVVTVACPGTIDVGDPATWQPTALPVRCLDAAGTPLPDDGYVISVKRIYLRDKDRNQNPVIAQVTWDGADWPENETRELVACSNDSSQYADCAGSPTKPKIAVHATPASVERGTDQFGTSFTEEVIAQYYVTLGSFEFEVRTWDSPETTLAMRSSARGVTQTLWMVVRDDRGGVAWTTRQVTVK
jgi:hypothetical protein